MKQAILFVAIAFFLSACAITGNVSLPEEKLCVILPMSGQWAFFGEGIFEGIDAAAQEAGYEVILEDDGYDFKKTVTAAYKLIGQGCPYIIVGAIEVANPILSLTEQSNTPVVISYDLTREVFENPLLHSTGYSIDTAGKRLAEFVGPKKGVLLRDLNDWNIYVTDAFAANTEGEILETYTLSEAEDFRSLVTKIKLHNPDFVYFSFAINDAAAFLKVAQEQGLETQFLSDAFFTVDLIDAAGDLANDLCKIDLPPTDVFMDAFVPELALLGYDTAKAIISASSPAQLGTTKYVSATGEMRTVSAEDREMVIYCIEDGVAVLQ